MDHYIFDKLLKDKVRYLFLYIYKLDEFERSIDKYIKKNGDSFYMYLFLSRSATDQLVYLLINEEISNSIERKPLFTLYDQLWEEDDKDGINILFRKNQLYDLHLKEIFVSKFNAILQNFFFDYQFSMWSAFELSISNIFNILSENHEEKLKKSHHNKFKKLLKNKIFKENKLSDSQTNLLDKSIDYFIKVFPKHISSDDKINYIFKEIKVHYSRDINNDKSILHFIRALRNTAHNAGIHNGNNISIIIDGFKYNLEKNKAGDFSSDINIIKLYFELLEIYISLILAVHEKLNKT